MTSKHIPVELTKLLTKLNFISQLKTGDKPCFSNMTVVKDEDILGWYKRWKHGESRNNNNRYIAELIEETIEAIERYKNDEDFLNLIINELIGVQNALNERKKTYEGDEYTKAEINTIMTNIKLQLHFNIDKIKALQKYNKK